MTPALVYDVETEGWTRFVLGTTRDESGVRVWRDERALVERILSTEGEVVAHNGGRFDHLWLLDAMDRHGLRREAEADVSGAGIVELRIGSTVLRDSARLYPMSLAELTAGAKRSIADLCGCGRGCGGYCAIRRDMSRAVRSRVEEYAAADSEELWRALRDMAGFAEAAELTLRRTVGATAWTSASRELGLGRPEYQRPEWTAIRRGYYGGRVEVWRRRSSAGYAYDVNSMYPWALAGVRFPVGYVGRVVGDGARRAYRRGAPGVYAAEVEVPECDYPVLPYRTTERLLFPWGRFSGSWVLPELERAEELGARVRVVAAHVWARSERVFTPWVERLFGLRRRHGKASREGKWLKLVLNSLSGKLGSRCEVGRVVIYPEPGSIRECECRVGRCSCGAPRPLDAAGRAWVETHSPSRIDSCAHAHLAAYLTAAARVKLHQALDASAVYGDTDSVFRERPLPAGEVGEDLGAWNLDGEYRDFRALAPKVYRYLQAGEERVRAKGIRDPEWRLLASAQPVAWESVAGVRSAGEGGFFARVERHRTVEENTGGRIAGRGARTRAPRVEEG